MSDALVYGFVGGLWSGMMILAATIVIVCRRITE